MLTPPDRDIEYFVRRFTLEKGFAVAADLDEKDALSTHQLDESRFGYPLPLIYFEELESLKDHFDVLLIRVDGFEFWILGLSRYRGSGLASRVDQQELVDAAMQFLPYTGKVSSTKLPVKVDLIELHAMDPPPDAVASLDTLRHSTTTGRNVTINTYSVGLTSRKVSHRSIFARPRARYLRQILRRRDESERSMVERVEKAGLSWPHILAGVLLAAALAFGLRMGLAWAGVTSGEAFAFVDYMGGFIAFGFAIYGRRIRSRSMMQGLLASIGYVVLLYGGFILFLDAPFRFWMAFNGACIAILGASIGLQSEMA